MNKLKKFLSLEAGIEIKSCLYFAIILFFYFCYQIIQGSLYASILFMAEMVLSCYVIVYLQVYVLKNFDESEHFDKKIMGYSLLCAAGYTAVSYFFNWYGRNKIATVCFFFYMLLCYVCIFLVYKMKRDFDTLELNQELTNFKHKRKEENTGERDASEEKREGWNFDGK